MSAANDEASGDLQDDRTGGIHIETVNPASQTYSANSRTTIETYEPEDSENGVLIPQRFEPYDPSDADLSMVLEAEFHDGTTRDLASVADGTTQSQESLLASLTTSDSGKQIKILRVIVEETAGADATEDLGDTTTRFLGQPKGNSGITVT